MKQETINGNAPMAAAGSDGAAHGPGYRTEDVAVAGGTLRVGIWGPEPGSKEPVPTVLALHGITASHQAWPMLATALPGVRIVAPDLRGRGRSNALPGPYGMPAHAQDLVAVLDALGVQSAVVAGHSMGGFAALVLAHQHPDRVASLVLVDGGLPLRAPENVSDDQVLQAVLGPAAARLAMTFKDRQEYEDFWKQHPAFADDWNDTVAGYVQYDLTGQAPALRPASNYDAVAEDSKDLHGGSSLLQAVGSVKHPVTFLRAPRGLLNEVPALYSPEQLEGWQQQLPQLTAVDVDDVNHYTIIMSERGIADVSSVVKSALQAATS